MDNISIKRTSTQNTNPFYNPRLANNGGGYYQPQTVVEFSNGWKLVEQDTSCGDFGGRVKSEVFNENGKSVLKFGFDCVSQEQSQWLYFGSCDGRLMSREDCHQNAVICNRLLGLCGIRSHIEADYQRTRETIVIDGSRRVKC